MSAASHADWRSGILEALVSALIAAVLMLPFIGLQTGDLSSGKPDLHWHVSSIFGIACGIFLLRLLLIAGGGFLQANKVNRVKESAQSRVVPWATGLMVLAAVFLPIMPFASRYLLDVGTMVLTYMALAFALNITVGYLGLLDLGFAGFYAAGAYSFALMAQATGLGFWTVLPFAGLMAGVIAVIVGYPVLRLRGDYFAVVTMGFGEVMRLILINWVSVTGGPNGITNVQRPTFFGLDFSRSSSEGHATFADYFGLDYSPMQRVMFVYYFVLFLALAVAILTVWLRRTRLGRSWEACREDEIAAAALGINRARIKMIAYALSAVLAGLVGAFFAARQGFVSPESFTFGESATVLAIVILGGVGHPLGIVLASMFVLGLPELFRAFESYRMLAFGFGLIAIMIMRPGGLMALRRPTAIIETKKSINQ